MKILDFGIAKLNIDQKQTATGVALGTPLYMAPEQWEAKTDMDGRVDIYALGMILYECLTGTYPFEAKNALQLMYAHTRKPVPDPGERAPLPERLRRLVLSMVQKQAADRPATMAAIESELALILAELGGGSAELSPFVAGPPRPLAATGDPVLSFTAEPSATGSGIGLAGSLGDAAVSAAAGLARSGAGAASSAVGVAQSAVGTAQSAGAVAQSAGMAQSAGVAQSAVGTAQSAGAVVQSAAGMAQPDVGLGQSSVGAAQSAAAAAVAPARRRAFMPALLVGGAIIAAGAAGAIALSRQQRPAVRRGVEPAPGPSALPAVPRARENRLVELGPGRFLLGRPGLADQPDGPAYPAPIGRFAIEVYEVSAGQLAEYVQALHPPGLKLPDAAAIAGNLPAVQLTREQALGYCAWRYPGGRLPTEAEWEYAARSGRPERLYPWAGTAADAAPGRAGGRANLGSASPQLEPVDSRPQGASAAGVYNLIGNAAEWTLSDSAPYPGGRAPVPRGLAVVRGGSAASPAHGVLATTRQFVAPGRADPFLGFRCAVSKN